MRRWVLLLVVLAVAGCSQQPPVRAGLPTVTDSAPAPSSAAPSSPALAEQKAAAGLPDCPAAGASAVVPKGLPDLTLPCLGGGRSTRLAGLRGTPMVINLWAQWCGPCRTEAPALAAIAAQAGDRVLIMGIDFADDRPDLAIEFARQAGWRYPQLYDGDKAITTALGLPASPPQTIFVRADGTIAYVHAGPFTSSDDLRAAIADHLGVRL